ncbi:MAG: hypothetical protein JO051_00450 [Acidobacteriaceae bacterium]|nr:hypothetical protein [Acidobacteriaceae bacterium]
MSAIFRVSAMLGLGCILPTLGFQQAATAPSQEQADAPQGIIQISSVRASPPALSCSNSGRSTLTVQTFFVLRDKSKALTAVVEIYGYRTDPAGNSFAIKEPRQRTVLLKESPAVATFEIECTRETVSGSLSFAARVDAAPKGVQVKPTDPPEDGLARLEVTK